MGLPYTPQRGSFPAGNSQTGQTITNGILYKILACPAVDHTDSLRGEHPQGAVCYNSGGNYSKYKGYVRGEAPKYAKNMRNP